MIRTGRSEFVEEVPSELIRRVVEDERHFELVMELGMRSAMTVPMVARSGTLGAMTFVTGPSGRRFDQRDLDLAEELARRCATAVENARLYGERAYIARTLQESLLPSELPEIPGIESAARFRPTGEGHDMGGDFYDLFPSGGRGWTVVMGDVCGKGPDAAAVTALARYTLRAAAMRERLPSRGLHVLNEALLRQRTDRRFCTVAYAYLESVDSGVQARLRQRGHPLPLLVRPNGEVLAVGAPGTLLGRGARPELRGPVRGARAGRCARLLHGRRDRGARRRRPRGGELVELLASVPARARTRSPRAWRRRRCARRAAIPATTSPCSCCGWRTSPTAEPAEVSDTSGLWTIGTGRTKTQPK